MYNTISVSAWQEYMFRRWKIWSPYWLLKSCGKFLNIHDVNTYIESEVMLKQLRS